MRIAIATCVNLPEPDPDEPVLLAALRAAGFEAGVLAWDDPGARFDGYDLCVIRSTWNYYRRIDAYSQWVDEAGATTRLFNPPRVFHWNKHKCYLRELEENGAPVVPTEFVPRVVAPKGDAVKPDLSALIARRRWTDFVLKPAVSAGSFRTYRFSADRIDEARKTLDNLTGDGDAMIQPFLAGVEQQGERSLVWVDGEFTHAIHKHPRFSGQDESVTLAEFTAELRTAGERVMAAVQGVKDFTIDDLLYARVDLMPGPSGEWLLSELEIIEPSLFFVEYPPALDRFVAAIRRRLR